VTLESSVTLSIFSGGRTARSSICGAQRCPSSSQKIVDGYRFAPFITSGQELANAACPTGKSLRFLSFLSSPRAKNKSLRRTPKSHLSSLLSHPSTRGVSRSSRTLGWDAVDATMSCVLEGIAEWANAHERSQRARRAAMLRTAKSCGSGAPTLALSSQRRISRLASDGGKKARSPGRARISRKTIAQGRPEAACTCGSTACFLLHANHGCGWHPAFPAPSLFPGDTMTGSTRGARRLRAQSAASGRMVARRHGDQTRAVRCCGTGGLSLIWRKAGP
jgi:hypothetical protein